MSAIPRSLACGLILSFALTIMASAPAWAEPMTVFVLGPRGGVAGDPPFSEEPATSITLIRVGPRVGMSGKSPFGRDQKEEFQQYDVAAIFGLPWAWQESTFGLKFDMRLLASAGEIAAAGTTGLMTTLVQCLAVSSPNGTVSLDVGGGAASMPATAPAFSVRPSMRAASIRRTPSSWRCAPAPALKRPDDSRRRVVASTASRACPPRCNTV